MGWASLDAWAGLANSGGQVMAEIPRPAVEGVTAYEIPDEDDVYSRAVAEWRKTERLEARRNKQTIKFPHGPVCLAFVADLHLGSAGTNYPRAFDEAQVIVTTPGMYLMSLGDFLDNYIVAKLLSTRMETRISIPDEWVLVKKYIRQTGPKLLASVAGNHVHWTQMLVGVDFFREAIARIAPASIYDADDARITVKVGQTNFPMRMRHKWLGNSIYNQTHGIERASKFDGDFLIGVGAHTHTGGVVRQFTTEGRTGVAVLCGAYKRVDEYARRKGYAKPNQSTAVAVIMDESGAIAGFNNIYFAARMMRAIYGKGKQ